MSSGSRLCARLSPEWAETGASETGASPLRPQDLTLTCQDRCQALRASGGSLQDATDMADGGGKEEPSPQLSRPPERRSGCFPAVPYPSSGPPPVYTSLHLSVPSLAWRSPAAVSITMPEATTMPHVRAGSQPAVFANVAEPGWLVSGLHGCQQTRLAQQRASGPCKRECDRATGSALRG